MGRAGKAKLQVWVLSCGFGQAEGGLGIWAQEEDGWGASLVRALQRDCQSPGKKTERCYVIGRPQILWFDFSENWDEFVLNMDEPQKHARHKGLQNV